MGNSLFLILIGFTISFSQDSLDERSFFEKVKTSYYVLNQTSTKNFTALVTSLKMEKFAQETWQNQEVFPLQLIWFAPDRFYLSQQGSPTIPPDKYREYQSLVDGIKMQMKGILLDLNRFYVAGIFQRLSDDYKFRCSEEAIQITSKEGEPTNLTHVKYLLGLNGSCLLIEISYPTENKIIIIYPEFMTLKDKWLCKGWTVQTMIAGEVQSGFKLQIEYNVNNSIWVPVEIAITVQKAEEPGTTYYDQIKLKNYLFDQSIRLLDNSTLNR